LWATNAVVVKIAVRDIPPLWAALLRFSPALPFIACFIKWNGSGFSVTGKDVFRISILAFLMVSQIYLFNLGSQYTTGGRITLFIFSYPLFVPLLAPLFIKEEKFELKNIVGCAIAFIGLIVALRSNISETTGSTIKGDIIELISCVNLSIVILYNKRLIKSIDKWRVIFWEFFIGIVLFFLGAIVFEKFQIRQVQPDAWLALIFQSIVISVFCFMSWQYLIAKHNSSSVSVFFFLTPLMGMAIGVLILNEAFDSDLIIGCMFVGAGIFIVNRTPPKY
jgi:drug/metabolite transporter (DMT)-like permease